MFVRPAINPETGERLTVRMPHTFRLMNIDGEEVPENFHWLWMLHQAHDIELCEPPTSAGPEASEQEPASDQPAEAPPEHATNDDPAAEAKQ